MNPDIIIWDIDGVLVNVSESYRQVIIDTVQYYFSECVGISLSKPLVSPSDIQAFKLAGGFNDDWELTYAMVLCFLSKLISENNVLAIESAKMLEIDEMVAKLNELGSSCEKHSLDVNLEEIASEVAKEGGGLSSLKNVLSKLFKESFVNAEAYWFPALIKRVFEEKYFGGELFPKKYGEKPIFYSGDGMILRERPMTNLKTLLELRKRYYFGVATGRERFEAEYSLNKHGFSRIFPSELVVAAGDTEEKKPSPQPLLECRRRVCARHKLPSKTPAFYVGDSVDDLTAARNAGFYFIAVVGGIADKESRDKTRNILHDKICDIIVDDIEELLIYI